MASFTPVDNLGDFSDAQKAAYYNAACEFLGVPKELNLLKYFWADQVEGKRNLILYATRGATDIIRDNRNISVTSLVQHDGPGYVSFTATASATGSNGESRFEMATGASSTEGLKGKALEIAVMFAQTKALRRVTLQFAGGGFLDESEVVSFETNIPASTSLSELSKLPTGATVEPNNAPGKDVTPEVVKLELKPETPAEFTVRMDGLRKDAIEAVAAKNAVVVASTPTPAPAEEPKRRKRRNAVTLESPGQPTPAAPPAPLPVPPVPAVQVATPPVVQVTVPPPVVQAVAPPVNTLVPPSTLPAVSISIPPFVTPVVVVGAPTPEQLKEYRTKLAKYANDILPSGGMMPTAGVGGVTMKLRNFANLQLGTQDVMRATAEQWDELLEFLDGFVASKGAAELVKYIDTAIGVK